MLKRIKLRDLFSLKVSLEDLFPKKYSHQVRPEVVHWREGDEIIIPIHLRFNPFSSIKTRELFPRAVRMEGGLRVYLWRVCPDQEIEIVPRFHYIKDYHNSGFQAHQFAPIKIPLADDVYNKSLRERKAWEKKKALEKQRNKPSEVRKRMIEQQRAELYHKFLEEVRTLDEELSNKVQEYRDLTINQ